MADLGTELGAVFLSVIPSMTELPKFFLEGGRKAADDFSRAFREATGQNFRDISREAGTALTTGLREGQTELERVTGAMGTALKAHEEALRRVGAETRNLTEMQKTGGYTYAAITEAQNRLTTARKAEVAALVEHKKSQTEYNDALANGAKEADEAEKSLRRAESAGTALGAAISGTATLAITGFTGIAAATLAVGAALVEVGETWESVERTMALHTTAMGKDLQGLEDTVKSVAANSSASIASIGDATAALAQKTGLRGGALQQLVTDFADAGKMLGKPIEVGPFVESMRALGVPMEQADDWLNQLFNISRQTDIPLNELLTTVSKNAVAFKEFNIPAGAAAALLAEMAEHGIDTGTSTKGLAAAAKEAAREGKDFGTYLRETVDQMERYHKEGNQIAEERVAERAFGPKAALGFKDAVDQGVLSVESLNEVLDIPGDKISDLFDRTRTLSDEFAIFHHVLDTALAPIGKAIDKDIGGGLEHMSEWVKTHGDVIVGWFRDVYDGALTAGEGIIKMFAPVAEMLGKIEYGIGWISGDDSLKQAGLDTENWAKGLSGPGGVIDGLEQAKKKGDAWFDGIQRQTAVTELLADALKETADGKGLQLKADTPEQREQVKKDLERLKEYGVTVGQGPDGKLTFTADTPENAKRVKDWLKTQSGQEITVNVVPVPGHPDGAPLPGRPAKPPPSEGAHTPPPPSGHPSPHGAFGWLDEILRQGPRDAGGWIRKHVLDPDPSGQSSIGKGWEGGGFQGGGWVTGMGHKRGPSDTVPAWLDPKEFVVRGGPAQKFAAELTWMNAQGFDDGGPVGDWAPGALPGPASSRPFGPFASKGTRASEEWQDRQTQAARSVERQRDRIEDLNNTIDDYNENLKSLNDQLNDPENPLTDEDRKKLQKEYNRAQQQLNRSIRDRSEAEEDLTLDQRKQLEAAQTPPGGEGGSGGDDLGKGFVKGIFQELGFPDVFGKAFTGFGALKLGSTFLGDLFGGGGSSGGSGGGPNIFGIPLGGLPGMGGRIPGVPGIPNTSGSGGTGFSMTPGTSPNVTPGSAAGTPAPVPSTPAPGLPSSPELSVHPASYGGTGGQGGTAQQIYNTVRAAGYSHGTGVAAVAAAKYESGLDPTIQEKGGSDHWGLFQEQGNYPGAHGTVADQANWFVGALNAAGGPSVVDADPSNVIANQVERGGYSGSNYDLGGAQALLGAPAPGSAGSAGPAIQTAAWAPSGPAPSGGQHYGLPKGTDIRQGAAGFPPWVYALGHKFGVLPSTYAGHQEGSGENQGIDWFPAGTTPDMSGASYSPEQTARLQNFAGYLQAAFPSENPSGQVIFANRGTGQETGFAMGQAVGPGTSQPQYYANDWKDHFGHVHTRFANAIPVPGGGGFDPGAAGGNIMPMINPPAPGTFPTPSVSSPSPSAQSDGGGNSITRSAMQGAGAVMQAISADSNNTFHAAFPSMKLGSDPLPGKRGPYETWNASLDTVAPGNVGRNTATAPAPPSDVMHAMQVTKARDAQQQAPAVSSGPGMTVNYDQRGSWQPTQSMKQDVREISNQTSFHPSMAPVMI